jgi:uncharacterized phage infection (PIP) family protein YhgE
MRLFEELNSNQEIRALLSAIFVSEELREAPARLDALESTVQQLVVFLRDLPDSLSKTMSDAVVPLAAAIDNLQTNLTNASRIQQAIPAQLADIRAFQETIPAQLENIRAFQEAIPAQLENIRAFQEAIPAQLENIRVFQQTMQAEIDAIRESQRTMQSTIGNLDNSVAEIKGWGLELLSSRRISRYSDVIKMTGLREVPQSEIRSIAESAFRHRDITEDEMSRVSNADAYFYGHSSLQQTDAYLVVQASYTVNANDVTRAIEQADILTRINGESVMPVVSGTHLRPDGAVAANGPVRVPYVPIGNGNSLRS